MAIFLDFETRSELNLKDVGAFKYFEHPSTDVLCLTYQVEGEDTKFWVPSMLMHRPLMQRVTQNNIRLYAWNATFDLLAWEFIMHKKYNWPALPDGLWHDVQAEAVSRGYPADLESAAPALGLSRQKLSGTNLIKLFSMPNPKTGQFNNPDDHPHQWQDFLTYCARDTTVMMEAHKKLGSITPRERKIWLHTLTINRRGIHVDSGACRNMIHLIGEKRNLLNAGITVHTGGEITKVTQRKRIQDWLLTRCSFPMADMQGTTVERSLDIIDDLLNGKHPDDLKLREAKILLTWYLVGNKSSTAKYNSMLKYLCADGTVKGFLFYHGAGTGRYSGRGVQFQNFPNKTLDNAEEIIDCLHEPSLEFVEMTIGDIMDVSKLLLRSMILAPPGMFLCVADYKSIEMVAVAWACSELELLQAFVRGLDQYRLMASKMYRVSYDAVTSDQRFAGKIAVLACGFGGAHNAILGMAEKMRMQVTEGQAVEWTKQFRNARPALERAWKDTETAAKRALISGEGKVFEVSSVRGLSFTRIGEDLVMILPSGRHITYPKAYTASLISKSNEAIEDILATPPRTRVINMIAYWVTSTTHKWEQRMLYGSLLFQNYIQGLCRDILVEAQLRLEDEGFPVVVNVHDELGSLVRNDDEKTFNRFRSVMIRRPDWLADDFPILADGYIAKRYRK